ncbi:MAG: SulP family inorganic anion transporter, partial [Coriobacteriia bacterium]|nr:SulP family inorganic anion transporter [Coriobacteriia bacterium]
MATLSKAQKKPKKFDPPLASLKGYQLKYLPEDLVSGAVVAALTLPISMGYADIVGLPAVYGLYASVVATLVFAIVTGTRHIVFGMDSATSAVAGTTLVSMGLVLGSQEIIDVMPIFTILVGAFLLLFWIFKAGKLVRYVPSVVMHGFIAGISLAVVISQIPTLLGTGYSGTSSFPFGTIAIFQSIPNATPAAVVIAVISLAMLWGIKKFMRKAPGPLIVLALATIVCGLLHLDEAGVAILGTVNASLPMPVVPNLDTVDMFTVVGGAFSVAVVITIESLLCLEA